MLEGLDLGAEVAIGTEAWVRNSATIRVDADLGRRQSRNAGSPKPQFRGCPGRTRSSPRGGWMLAALRVLVRVSMLGGHEVWRRGWGWHWVLSATLRVPG
jgi:hypothetical protein